MIKKLAALFVFIFILTAGAAHAAEGGGEETGSIIDFFSIGGGCGGGGPAPCDDDPKNGLFASIACRVMKSFNTGVVPLYCNIVSNPEYLAAIDAAMALYVVLLGFSFIFGLVPMTAGTLVAKLLKATIVYAITINADLYFNLIYNTVLQTPQDAVRILLNSATGAAAGGAGSENFFQYVDKNMFKVMNEVFYSQATEGSGQTYTKSNLKVFVIGLALWQLGGDLIGGLFFAVTIGWVLAFFSIMVRYLLAMLSLMFVLMLGPLFLPTLLFEQTKYLAEEWFYMLLNFIMQIVLVVAFVLMVQVFFIEFYKTISDAMEKGTMTQSSDKGLVTFNDSTAPDGAAFRVEKRNSKGFSPQEAEQFYNSAFGTTYQDDLPKKVIKFLGMLVMVLCSITFLSYVPSLAALLIGRPRFVRIFAGEQFGPQDRTKQADLLGQEKTRGPGFDVNALTEARPGGR